MEDGTVDAAVTTQSDLAFREVCGRRHAGTAHAMFMFIALFPVGLLAVVMLLARLERGLTNEPRPAAGSSSGHVTAGRKRTPVAGSGTGLTRARARSITSPTLFTGGRR